MFECPEYINFARQINATLSGKVVKEGSLGNSPHKFVWYNRSPEAFAALVPGKKVGQARAQGKWLFTPLEPGYMLLFGENGGKILYHAPGSKLPEKYHILITFEDGSALTAMTQMWGAFELFDSGKELERQYVKDMKPTPVDPDFSFPYFDVLINVLLEGEKRSVKSLLTQDQIIPGVGNALAQDIMFNARLHPRHPLAGLNLEQRLSLYNAIISTVQAAIAGGGRDDEADLFGKPGGYRRIMSSKSAGQPCPACGKPIEKIQYLGGACYFCPLCQV